MNDQKHQYAPGTRAARLLQLRDAVLPHELAMREVSPGVFELIVDMYVIQYSLPHPLAAHGLCNITIWQRGAVPRGFSMHGDAITSFSWTYWDEVFIQDFKCGEWENELPRLLTGRVPSEGGAPG
jgi:hypothetical protein